MKARKFDDILRIFNEKFDIVITLHTFCYLYVTDTLIKDEMLCVVYLK